MNSAVIFVDDEARRKGKLPCVGVRFGTQIIPRGCYIVGFLTSDGQEALSRPYLGGDHTQWEAALMYARAVLAGEWPEEPDLL